jgi:hypothetical protein
MSWNWASIGIRAFSFVCQVIFKKEVDNMITRHYSGNKFPIVLALILVFLLITASPVTAAGVRPETVTPIPEGNAGSDWLQYTSDGHVLGFSSSGVVIASTDHMLKTEFVNANPVSPQSDTADRTAAFSLVTYSGLWSGVDLVYSADPGSIVKSTWYIAPDGIAGSVNQIHLRYNRPVSLDAAGNLVTAFDAGSLTESRPVAWQEIDGQKRAAAVSYRLCSENEAGFALEDYLPGIPLVIDPDITWSTFMGGDDADRAEAIAVDSSGNVYVTGDSFATWGSPKRAFYGSTRDAFVAKLSSSGSLSWNTFLGGSGADAGYGIAVDGSYVYVTGESGPAWSETPVRGYSNGGDAFAARINSSTGILSWYTFLGGTAWDNGKGIAVDSSGNVFVVGDSHATWGSPVRAHYANSNNKDAFVARLDSAGALVWNTFLGDLGGDDGIAIALDSTSVYVSGYCNATWGTSPKRNYTSGNDAFAAKLDTDGGLTWHTFLGGTGEDLSFGIAVYSGKVYTSGFSSATWGSPKRAYTSSNDAFAAALDSSGVLSWNTFLGGSGSDPAIGIAVDSSGNIYVAGYSGATWGSPARAYTSGNDAYTAKLDSSGVLTWNTFLGGSGTDESCYGGMQVNSTSVYVAGFSTATWGSPIQSFTASSEEGFVVKFDNGNTGGTSNRVGGKFTPVNRMGLIVPLLVLVSGFIIGGSFLVWRRSKGN